jgi:hydantoinase/carbamoylase family amidase
VPSLTADLEAAAGIGADPRGGVSRFAWTPELADANDWLAERLTELGLAVELDPAGNVIGRWQEGEGSAVLVGSHLDTVPNGGRYDGALGVLAALDVVRRLKADGVELQRPLWVISFNDEEGARFQTGMLGSRAFCGDCAVEDWSGRGVPEAMREAGFDFERLGAARGVDGVGAYLELHIEQGPVLERAGVDLGIVTAITGMLGFRVRFLGEANHAGTTPMELRRDALAGAARTVLALRDEARVRDDMTANVGVISAEPGGFNVVPGAAELTIDVRSPSGDGFARLEPFVRETLERIAAEEGLGVEARETHRKPPVELDAALQARLEEAAAAEGATAMRLPSGAGHDAMVLAHHVPAVMLFVPSHAGLSHTPEEFSSAEHCELGARVLARAVRSLVLSE